MTTKIVFNSTVMLKRNVAAKARTQGLTLTGFLNNAMQAYAKGYVDFDLFERDLTQAREEKKTGKGISSKDMRKALGMSARA